MDDSQKGPLTAAQLLAIWKGSVDSVYSDPYVAAGEGKGLEVHTQAFAQFERVSQAVDRTFQAFYALPWSGQTNPPAGNGQQATCELEFARTGRLGEALVLGQGLLWVDEDAQDAGLNGPVDVDTGRRYLLAETVVFFPGEQGPFPALAVAEKPGYGYNDPLPGSLKILEQPGAGRTNDLATVTKVLAALPPANQTPTQQMVLTGQDTPDMFTPDQVGQYVGFISGANAGKSGRIVGFYAPTSTAGSGVQLEQLASMLLTATPSPAFVVGGARVVVKNGATVVGSGVVLAARPGPGGYCVAIALTSGSAAPLPGYTLSQDLSPSGTATGTIAVVFTGGQYAAEAPSGSPLAGGAEWRVLDWALDWGLTSANALSPDGGQIDMLGALGGEKNLTQLPGEPADDYRLRISRVADVVSPNSLRRALVRTVGPTGWCYREVGSALLPGLFADRTDAGGDAFDLGSLVFAGAYASGFIPGERVQYIQNYANGGVAVLAEGFWGTTCAATPTANPAGSYPPSYLAPAYSPASGGGTFTLVLAPGRFSLPLPAIPVQLSDRIVGLTSGATFGPTSQVATKLDPLRWHCLLSYADMRAFFLAGVPRMGLGDFGFAYDAGTQDAYDAGAPWLNFWDGYPAGNPAFYGRVFEDLGRSKAGGVGYELYETNGQPCA